MFRVPGQLSTPLAHAINVITTLIPSPCFDKHFLFIIADEIPNWILKEFSDFLAFPIIQILNALYREQPLPTVWKMSDVPLLPKKNLACTRPEEKPTTHFIDTMRRKAGRGVCCRRLC